MNTISRFLEPIDIPKMARVEVTFEQSAILDIPRGTRLQLDRDNIAQSIMPQASIAITVGSRGINGMVEMVREIVSFCCEKGARPFIVPSMGSHGGATAEGQEKLLASYGVTEQSVGAPIRSSMEVIQVASLSDGSPIYMDRYAAEADGIIVFNRIKPHTGFRGVYESGLVKMMAVGLGKQAGANAIHNRSIAELGNSVAQCGKAVLDTGKILFGLACVENAYDQTHMIVAIPGDEIFDREPGYLDMARALMPKIPFEDLDILIVDQLGKNISGSGMDPNITHSFIPESSISRAGRAGRIVALDLTNETHGNAQGIGCADMVTRRLFEKIDYEQMYMNSLTTGVTESIKIPMFFDSQALAIKAAIQSLTKPDKSNLRIVRIRNTMHLNEMHVSPSLLPELDRLSGVKQLEPLLPLAFDADGNLF